MRLLTLKLFFISLFFCQVSHATIVQMQSEYGNIRINLFDETTPITVANFLAYLEDGAYDDVIIHRLIPSFIMQSGGFKFNDLQEIINVPLRASIQNEPVYSNVRGTIAMAKRDGYPNSASSSWFINLVDNSKNLDVQNGGFTVFGQVFAEDMEIIDGITGIQTFNYGGAASDLPLQNFTINDAESGKVREYDNYVKISNTVTIDFDVDTVTPANLTPAENVLITQLQTDEAGSLPYLLCLALGALLVRRKAKVA